MEEVPHHVNHKKNRLWLGGDGDGSRFKYTIDGLRKGEGRTTELLTVMAETPTRPQGYNTMELLAMEFGAELVDEVVIGEIVDEATFKADCAVIWAECMLVETAPGAAPGAKELLEFERRARVQYHDLFLEPEGLRPGRSGGGFLIRTIPGVEPPHRSPYRQTAVEWEEYKKQTTELLKKSKIRSSHSLYASPVRFVPKPGAKWRMCLFVCNHTAFGRLRPWHNLNLFRVHHQCEPWVSPQPSWIQVVPS
jgi:hypothetical protein